MNGQKKGKEESQVSLLKVKSQPPQGQGKVMCET
jgi:hypothetical protein